MNTLRFGETFVAKYPGNLRYGVMYAIGRDRANRGRPILLNVNPSIDLSNVTDAPVFGEGDRFEAEGETFEVTTTEGFALSIDRINYAEVSKTPAA